MQFSGTQVLVGGFALACAVAAGTWHIRSDRLEDLQAQVDSLKEASELGYAELVTSIVSASKELDRKLSNLEDIHALEKSNEELEEALSEAQARSESEREQLSKETKRLASELARKSERLDSILAEDVTFDLEPGSGIELAAGTVAVGFTKSNIEGECRITIGNETLLLETGGYVELESRGRSCRVILTRCEYGAYKPAEFRFLCGGYDSEGAR